MFHRGLRILTYNILLSVLLQFQYLSLTSGHVLFKVCHEFTAVAAAPVVVAIIVVSVVKVTVVVLVVQ